MKRVLDLLFALLAFILLLPAFFTIGLLIKILSPGPILFKQERIGLNKVPFTILKFRTMLVESKHNIPLTVGENDPRITVFGSFLRKLKLDELPQLLNIICGDMSFVGPRPEVAKYVEHYTDEQQVVFQTRPGLTDLASIEFRNENQLLEGKQDPEKYYINEILPKKLQYGISYINNKNVFLDLYIVFKTAWVVFFK